MDEREKTGSISILGFYERRARRILPALVIVLLCCVPFAWFWMLPTELELFGKAITATMLFVSNILFWTTSGYFSPNTDLIPLLHTWSLAVEEQYYIIFPIALAIVWKLGRFWVGFLIAFFMLASFGFGEWASHNMPSAAFYLFPTRAWELLVGAFVALWTFRNEPPRKFFAQSVSLIGLGAIVIAIVFYDDHTPWPGIWALAPVLGTAAVIWGGSTTLVAKMLSLRLLVGIGLISYSAYLWHQPLFAFARLRSIDEPSQALMLGLSLATLFLAWLSWRYVEQPFRNQKLFGQTAIVSSSLVMIAALSISGVWLAINQGLPGRYPDWQRAWLVPPKGGFGQYVEGPYLRNLKPMGNEPAEGAILLVGDSYSQDFYNILRLGGALETDTLHRHFIHNTCQPVLAEHRTEQTSDNQGSANCQSAAISPDQLSLMARYKVVLIATNWKDWSIDHGIKLARAIEDAGGKVVVVGSKRFEPSSLRAFAGQTFETLSNIRQPFPQHILNFDSKLLQEFGGERFISVMDELCDKQLENGCRLTTDAGVPISYDGGHLTPQGAEYLSSLLSPRIKAMLAVIEANN